MVRLSDYEAVTQSHTSAGGPTPTAMKYYVEQLMKPRGKSVTEKLQLKKNVGLPAGSG